MDRLKAWLSRYEKAIAGAVMTLTLIAMFTLRLSRSQISTLCLTFAWAAYFLKKRVWISIVAWLAIIPISVYASFAYVLETEIIHPTPLQHLPVVNASVILGGDRLRLHAAERCFAATVCFYVPGSDLCVIAAHSCESASGQTLEAALDPFTNTGISTPSTCPKSDPGAATVTVRVVSDTNFGVVLSGVRFPAGARDELLVGEAEDIHVGEEALLYSSTCGVVSCRVLGFDMVKDNHMLIIEVLDKNVRIGSGDSGSPLVQGGKIIGFAAGTHAIPYRGPRLVLVRPACEVYSQLEADLK